MQRSYNVKNKTVSGGKEFTGKIVSTSGLKTVHVSVGHMKTHPLYRKAVRVTKTFAAGNDIADIAVGDTVIIKETRPISKTKHFIVIKKL